MQRETPTAPRNTSGKTFAPRVRTPAALFLITLAEKYKLDLFTADATAVFLNAALEKKAYVRPQFFIEAPRKVWKLKRNLYGLHQSRANWFKHLNNVARDRLGFTQSKSEPVSTSNGMRIA